MDEVILIFSTAPDAETAKRIARILVEEKLAACVSLMPAVQSIYRWEGKVEEAIEISLMIKTKRSSFASLSDQIKAIHPYDVPELVALPVIDGLPAYLNWVRDETSD